MQSTGYPFITPSSTCLSEDLLFFDTFSHSGNEKDNFDLVQFPSPVVIDLIKIVPLGQPIEAKIPGNVRLGATNPSNCELEFFINDLSKQDAHTMTDLGKFYCSEKETDFSPPQQIQTDGLLLRGSYRTLTLAIFGQIASFDEKPEDEQIIQSAASPPAQTPASPVASERDIPYIVRTLDQDIFRRARNESELFSESNVKSLELEKEEILFDDEHMIDNQITDIGDSEAPSKDQLASDELSSSEGGPSIGFTPRDRKNEDIDFSNSTEADNYVKRPNKEDPNKQTSRTLDSVDVEDFEGAGQEDDKSNDYNGSGAEEWSFNADTYRPKPLLYFPDPSQTLQERSILTQSSKSDNPKSRETIQKEVEKIREMFDLVGSNNEQKSEEWVLLIEDLTNDVANMSLSQTVNNGEMLELLVKQICLGLDMNLALKQKQTAFKVRHLRAGIKLATILFNCGKVVASALLEASIPYRVLQLYSQDQMSLPIRLLILKCLNVVCDTVDGVEHMLSSQYKWVDAKTRLDDIKNRKLRQELLKKSPQERQDAISKFEHPTNDSNQYPVKTEEDLASKHYLSPRKNSPDKTLPELEGKEGTSSDNLTCYQYLVLILLSQPTTRVTIAIGNLLKKIHLYQNLMKLSVTNLQEHEESEDSVFDLEKSTGQRDNLEQSLQIFQEIVNLTKDKGLGIAQPVRYLPAKVQFQVRPNHSDTFMAIYRWLKHFHTLDLLNTLLSTPSVDIFDSMSTTEIEQSIRLQNLCLVFLQQILDSPRGIQLFLTADCCEVAGSLIRTLAEKRCPKRSSHLRMSDGIENCFATLCREESQSAANYHDMSLRLSYNLKIFSCIDKLFYFHRESMNKRAESTLHDPEKVLHQLYIMSEHPYGLAAIVKHFSCIGNLDCLFRFLDMPEQHKQLEFVKETSIDYALELIGTFFRLNNNVLEIADEYIETLMEICKNKEKTLSVRIKSLLPWLTPFDAEQPLPLITYSEDTFKQLTRVIRKCIPNYSIPFAKGLNFELPPQMITAVRILRQLCIPPQVESFLEANFDIYSLQRLTTSDNKPPSFMAFVDSLPHHQNHNQSWNLNLQMSRNNGMINNMYDDSMADQLSQISSTFKLFQPYDESICGELKYHYGVMQIFEQEGLKRLLNTLRELTGNYPRPIYQSAALSGFRGRIVISYIHSVIILLHSIVCHLIDARGSEFRDTSVIPVVLETYSLLCFVPKPDCKMNSNSSISGTSRRDSVKENDLASLQKSISLKSDNYQLAQQTKKLILSILMSYTQMCLSVSESEEKVISKSMWTKMLREVIDFTLSTPIFFHHGLDVLTKILPSPLPCSSMMDSIDQEQLFKNINHRKLWSAHLHPLHQQLEQMISHLSICYQSNIRTLLCYLCNQLCDLSSSAACMVAKIITDTLISCAAKLNLDTNGNLSPEQQQQSQPRQQQPQSHNQTQQPSSGGDDRLDLHVLSGTKESAYAVKMILNLLSNLITNQAFETAFTNHLQAMGKKDEKLLINLQSTLKLNEDYRPDELIEENLNSGANGCTNSVNYLIESIKAMNDNATKDGYAVIEVAPPEELTKINLLDVARKTSDRFSLNSGLKKTYRLKVLLDLNSCAHRSSESSSSKRFDHAPYNSQYQEISVQSSHKAYVAPLRGRGRPVLRPDSFRSRPQNTSRPPSIHVDDFIDIYGDNLAQSSSNRYMGGSSSSNKPLIGYRSRRARLSSHHP